MKNLRSGHRQRMIKKFLVNADNFSKSDLIEMILFLCIPRKDVKDLALLLNDKFSSILALLSANTDTLLGMEGIGESTAYTIKLIYKLIEQILLEKIEKKDIINNFHQLIEYCKIQCAEKNYEELRIIYLNSKNYIISSEVCSKGTISMVNIYPREIIKRCLELSAVSVILVHNHPSGDPSPSEEDILVTQHLNEKLSVLKITLYDHLIIGKDNFYSLRQNKNF